jgi:hypothetical protein
MAEKIKLMADYGCYPLWWASSDKVGDIDPTTLPLSPKTISRLEKWADVYDEKLNWDDPASSSFPNNETRDAFEEEGISLWKQLQKELAPTYDVVYFSERLGEAIAITSHTKNIGV